MVQSFPSDDLVPVEHSRNKDAMRCALLQGPMPCFAGISQGDTRTQALTGYQGIGGRVKTAAYGGGDRTEGQFSRAAEIKIWLFSGDKDLQSSA
jgi:hypothetical protein